MACLAIMYNVQPFPNSGDAFTYGKLNAGEAQWEKFAFEHVAVVVLYVSVLQVTVTSVCFIVFYTASQELLATVKACCFGCMSVCCMVIHSSLVECADQA